MIKNVISARNLHKQNVEPYRFSVLGSPLEPKPKKEPQGKTEKKKKRAKNFSNRAYKETRVELQMKQ